MTSNKKLLLLYLNSSFLYLISLINCQVLLAYEHSPVVLKHLNIAKEYVDKSNYKQAKIELEAALKQDPKSPDILNNLGSICLQLSQTDKDPNKSTNQLNAAKNYFTDALEIDPDFPAAWNGMADIYYLSGQTQEAVSYYKKALSLSPKHSYESLTNLANALRDIGKIEEAQDNYEKAISINPMYAPAHNGYAELLFDQHNLEKAYKEVAEAIKLKPDYATAYYHLGLIETGLDNKNDALKAYLLSLRYETNSHYAQETQKLIDKLNINSNDISFEDLKEFQTKVSQSAFIPKATEELNTQESEPKNSTAKMAQSQVEATNVPKNNQEVSITHIDSFIANKQWVLAANAISKLLKTHPTDPVLLNELGLILLNQKKYSEAQKVLEQAILESNYKLIAAYYNLGQVYLAKHNAAKAQSYLEQAKLLAGKQNKNCNLINNSLAISYKQQGNFLAAESAYRESLSSDANNNPVIHYNLAILLEQMDKPKEAAKEFQTYLELSPDGLNAKNAHTHLKNLL